MLFDDNSELREAHSSSHDIDDHTDTDAGGRDQRIYPLVP